MSLLKFMFKLMGQAGDRDRFDGGSAHVTHSVTHSVRSTTIAVSPCSPFSGLEDTIPFLGTEFTLLLVKCHFLLVFEPLVCGGRFHCIHVGQRQIENRAEGTR